MNEQQHPNPGNGNAERLIISRTDEGFRVYSPAEPTKSYIVGGGPEEPTCTCPDFQYHQGDPHWRCKHIQAVLDQLGTMPAGDRYDQEERRAIQNENQVEAPPKNGGAPAMFTPLLQRSEILRWVACLHQVVCGPWALWRSI